MKEDTTLSVIYCSPTHTSQKIARAIADGLNLNKRLEIDLTYNIGTTPIAVEDGIAIIAVPVYAGRVAPFALERVKRLAAQNIPTILVALYGNRDYEDALLELKDTVTPQGFKPCAAGAFIGEHSFSRPEMPTAEGRPDANDLEKAHQFGRDIRTLLEKTSDDIPAVQVKGNHPYRFVATSQVVAPICNENCHGCGLCVDVCPTDAIHLSTDYVISTEAEKCVKCCACVKVCPNGARIFKTPYTEKLHVNFSARREPELFFGSSK